MRGLTGTHLLKLPVRLHGIELGRPVDIVVDADARRAVGIALLCGDHVERFLPFGAAAVSDDEILVDSALAVIDDPRFYLERGHTLRALRGAPVTRRGELEGRLADVVVGTDGALVGLVVDAGGGARRVDVTGDVAVTVAAARPAA
jgi:hypothetical protein